LRPPVGILGVRGAPIGSMMHYVFCHGLYSPESGT
jgi:hypothetical protein